jgi:DNA-binding NtrC family response regulator
VKTLKEHILLAEKKALLISEKRCNGNKLKMAKMLGITRPTLYDLINKHNMKVTK